MEEQKEHKRRVRYKGTHPRNYNEKYKELNPEKYQGTIEHVIQKGSTPAGMHIPISVRWMSIRSRWQKQKNDWPRRGTALRF